MATAIQYVTKTIKLIPGESFTLPPDATIIFASDSGGLGSTCDNIPETEPLSCYYYQWELEGPNSGSDAWENGTLVELKLGGSTFSINGDAYLENNGGAAKLENALVAAGYQKINIPAGAAVGDRILWSVCFKTTPTIAATSYLTILSSDDTLMLIPARLLSASTAPPCACAV